MNPEINTRVRALDSSRTEERPIEKHERQKLFESIMILSTCLHLSKFHTANLSAFKGHCNISWFFLNRFSSIDSIAFSISFELNILRPFARLRKLHAMMNHFVGSH